MESYRSDLDHKLKLRPKEGMEYMGCCDATHVPIPMTLANPDPNPGDRE